MNDYPSQSPWGPHGPQMNLPSATPNPTAQDPAPSFQSWGTGAAAPAAPTWSGSGGGQTASAGPTSAGGYAAAGRSIAPTMRRLAVAGLVLGGVIGLARGVMLHLPTTAVALLTVRIGVAGAAAGASVPPAFRVLGALLGAAVWLVIVLLLWFVAMAALGPLGLPALFR